MRDGYPRLTAEEAAAHVTNGMTVVTSGFTSAGAIKAVGPALALRAEEFHRQGKPFKVKLLTGASTGDKLDGVLARADALSLRAPYQSDPLERRMINQGQIPFFDMHLSHIPQYTDYGFFGQLDVAVVEATSISPEGHVYLTASGGCTPTWLKKAKRVIIEVNRYHSPRLREMYDIYDTPPPPRRREVPIYHPLDKIGTPFAYVDPSKVIGIVETNEPDEQTSFRAYDEVCAAIGGHVVDFLVSEQKAGRIPFEMLPLQAGVGNVANAVMASLGADRRIPPFYFYTEVCMDAMVDLLANGRCLGASTCSLSVSQEKLREMYANFDQFANRIVLRPQSITNHPEVIRRLGVISMNTAIEVDIYGHVNSTMVMGTQLMNGIGGSGDFTRNAYMSIFMTPSVAKGGLISSIVPFCSHVDHNEHSVQVVVTEQGLADLRGKTPRQRAEAIIANCSHPDYRPLLRDYLEHATQGHVCHDLRHAFDFHIRYMETGSMAMAAVEPAGAGR